MNRELWNQVKFNVSAKNQNSTAHRVMLDSLVPVSEVTSLDGTKLEFKVPSDYHKDWVQDHLIGDICTELSKIYDHVFEVDVVVENIVLRSPEAQAAFENSTPIYGHFSQPLNPSGAADSFRRDSSMRPEYKFSTFFVGKNNEFAHAASHAVAENPGDVKNNPLFIFGPTGLGKTHLLNAIGNHIRLKFPDLRILYVSAERFLNECVSGIRHKEMAKFRKKYREDCDVLLMDDIHVLGRGDAVQEEFFHTLNSFFENRRQVVVASDRMPKDITGLEDRIRTRLEGGLTADILMPDLETRMAILKYKAETLNIQLPDDVSQYLAKISKRSIRELEGNLNKVRMFSQLQGLNVTMDLVRHILVNHTPESNNLTIDDIIRLVSEAYKVRTTDLKAKNRQKPIVTARQVAMKLTQKYLGKSLKDIGRAFGGKDHTTVLNAIRKIDSQLQSDSDLRRDFEEIESRIHNITGV
ncbi:MAG: chromosomal replication initiator protein DnaA [Bdellovibrionales bacterium]|nr:chromosomal replication initiator protein DnaA [Bdellovibrionales bacterium]